MENDAKKGIMFLPIGILAWFLSAAVLIPVGALLCYLLFHGSQALGYMSSVLCFVSAASAGAAAERCRGGGALYIGVIMGCIILSILILLGYIADSSNLDTGGIISITTFTLTGAVFGSVFLGRGKRHIKGKRMRIK